MCLDRIYVYIFSPNGNTFLSKEEKKPVWPLWKRKNQRNKIKFHKNKIHLRQQDKSEFTKKGRWWLPEIGVIWWEEGYTLGAKKKSQQQESWSLRANGSFRDCSASKELAGGLTELFPFHFNIFFSFSFLFSKTKKMDESQEKEEVNE